MLAGPSEFATRRLARRRRHHPRRPEPPGVLGSSLHHHPEQSPHAHHRRTLVPPSRIIPDRGGNAREEEGRAITVGASEATLKSLVSKLGSLLAEEYALIRGDIQYIKDELASMQAFSVPQQPQQGRRRRQQGHDDQTEDWMKQVRDVAYDIEDCIDDFAHGHRPDPRGTGCLVAIRKTLYEIRTCSTRRDIAAQVVELKACAQQVGEHRTRYSVRDPQPSKASGVLPGLTEHGAAEHQQVARQLVRVRQPVGTVARTCRISRDGWRRRMSGGRRPGCCPSSASVSWGRPPSPWRCARNLGPSSCAGPCSLCRRSLPPPNQKKVEHTTSSGGNKQKKIPVVGSMLSRLRSMAAPSWKKHRQIQAELRNYLGQNRYMHAVDSSLCFLL
ncbi:hypothetical protein U9M48_000448 [Paspalum notatum var. saurae]|uniref:Disease resistance N-terminal domain-containing protein n=1 Tax=Paspalum notatum var. saurae TaxID=547442 RepID=A0AAQ3SFZ0_PASNO